MNDILNEKKIDTEHLFIRSKYFRQTLSSDSYVQAKHVI